MVQARRRRFVEQLPGGACDIRRIARGNRAIRKDAHFVAVSNGFENGSKAPEALASGRRCSKQTLHPKDPRARRVERKPVPEELGGGVRPPRIWRGVLRIGRVCLAVEHEVTAVVHERRVELRAGPCECEGTECIDLECVRRVILRTVNVVIRRAVDDEIGFDISDGGLNGSLVRYVELLMADPDHLRHTREFPDDRAAKQALFAGDENAHHAGSAEPNASTTAPC